MVEFPQGAREEGRLAYQAGVPLSVLSMYSNNPCTAAGDMSVLGVNFRLLA